MRYTHERFVLMRRILLRYFYDLCVFTLLPVSGVPVCLWPLLTPWLPWCLTPVSPSLSPGPLWFLPSFMAITPTRLRACLMVPVSSVCGLLPPCSSGLYTCFFFHLQNCKSNKSFNTLSQRSSAFPTSTCLFPLICPVTVVRGGGGPLSRMLMNQTLLCCMLWQRRWTWSGPPPSDCSLSFTGSLFLPLALTL